MYCKGCGKQIDDNSAFCPHCGKSTAVAQATTKPKKKKHPLLGAILLILGIGLFVGAMTGGNEKEPEKVGGSTGTTAASEKKENNVFAVGDVVSLNDIKVTLVDVSENSGGNYMTPSEGKVYIVCEFEIENNSDADIAISSLMSFEAYIDDYATSMNISATLSTDKTQLDGTVAPGKKMRGVIGYEVDTNWGTLEIRFTPDFWARKDIVFSVENTH